MLQNHGWKYGFYLSISPLTSLKRRSDFPVAIRCLMVHKISDFFRYIVSSFMFVHCKRSFFLGWKLSLHRCHRQLLVNPHQRTIDHQKLPQHFPLHCTQQFHRLIRKSVVFYNYIFIVNRWAFLLLWCCWSKVCNLSPCCTFCISQTDITIAYPLLQVYSYQVIQSVMSFFLVFVIVQLLDRIHHLTRRKGEPPA